MPSNDTTYLRRVWWAVRDKDGCDAEYDTARHAIDDYHNWWNAKWPQDAPYRVVRCEVHETEVDPMGLEAAYLALKQELADAKREAKYEGDWAEQSIAEVARMKEEMMRAQRERDRADDRAEHWYGQYEALKQENLNLRIRMEVDNEP